MKTVYKIIALLVFSYTLQFCSKSVEYNSTSTTGTGSGSGSGSGSNGPSTSNPASTPYSAGQAGVYNPADTSKKDTSKSKVPSLSITYTRTSPCSSIGETFNFVCTPNSYVPVGATYLWYMGDGSTKNTSTVTGYSYIYASTYHVVVQAFSNGIVVASKDTMVKAYGTIYIKPTASFTITQPLSTNQNYIVCTNTIQSNVAYVTSWDFGDGTTSTLSSPTHTYATLSTNQTYKVLLTATGDSSGCSDTISHFITINGVAVTPSCSIIHSEHDTCGPGKETFNFSANVVGAPAGSTYNWNYGDGINDLGASVTHQYTNQSNYNVILTISNSSITCSQVVKANGVNNFPIANFTYTVSSAGNTFNFQDSTIMKSGNIQAYFWDFGDSTQAHISNPTHTYAKAAVASTKIVIYGVQASNSCVSNITKTVFVPSL